MFYEKYLKQSHSWSTETQMTPEKTVYSEFIEEQMANTMESRTILNKDFDPIPHTS